MNNPSSQQGFTLLELLVSITLLAVIMAFMTGALRYSHRAWSVSETLNAQGPAIVARNFLHHNLAGALPMRRRGADGKVEIVFSGQSDRIAFITDLPEQAAAGGLYRVLVFSINNELRLELAPYHPHLHAQVAVENRVLLKGISRFGVFYFGPHEKDAEPSWADRWSRRDRPPSLVRLEVAFEDRRRWTPLVVALKLHK